MAKGRWVMESVTMTDMGDFYIVYARTDPGLDSIVVTGSNNYPNGLNWTTESKSGEATRNERRRALAEAGRVYSEVVHTLMCSSVQSDR